MNKIKVVKSDSAPKTKGSTPVSHGVGRRKSAVARVWLRRGTGKMEVNGRDYKTYFDTEMAQLDAAKPFRVVPAVTGNYDYAANVRGGGLPAQADAISLAIARALVELDESIKSILRKNGLMTSDSRLKERKKYGQKAARRKFQFVKR
jgi:small subunit ribosomal protein S9